MDPRLRATPAGAFCLAAVWLACAARSGDPASNAPARLEPVPFTAVTLDDEFWAPRLARNREVTVPHILEQNEATGRVANFRRAAGLELWNYRMLLRTGDVRYVDVMERILYNGALSGILEEGDLFFYTNPLASSGDHQRRPYFRTACCPGNLARLMGTLPGLVYASATSRRRDVLYVNLFVAGMATAELAGGPVRVRQETRYPWEGKVRIELDPGAPRELEVRVRIPGWARGEVVPSDLYRFDDTFAEAVSPSAVVRIGGEPEPIEVRDGWATARRVFRSGDTIEVELPMPVRRVRAHPRIENDAGRVALQRGPPVYAVEGIDHGGRVHDLALAAEAMFEVVERPDLLGGVVTIETTGRRIGARGEAGEETGEEVAEGVTITAIPYATWANRGKGEMAVWLPVLEADDSPEMS